MRGLESPLLHRRKLKRFRRRGGDSVKRLIYNIVGLLALLIACALPADAAGPGGYHGSGGYRGPGGYHGYGGNHGYGGYHGHGRYYGHGGHNGHGNSYSTRIFIGPGWGPRWWGPPAYPYYPYYSNYPAPPVVIEQQPQAYVQQHQQESDYWYYCQDPQRPQATTPTLNPARAGGCRWCRTLLHPADEGIASDHQSNPSHLVFRATSFLGGMGGW